jgi:hypothetical protein
VLASPVGRARWLLLRYLGVTLVQSAVTTAGLAVVGVLAVVERVALPGLVGHAALQLASAALVTALAAAFAARIPAGLAGLCAAGVVVAGHLADEYGRLAIDHPALAVLDGVLFTVLPDLDLLDPQHALVHGRAVAVVGPLVYAALWTLGLLALAIAGVQRRDLP